MRKAAVAPLPRPPVALHVPPLCWVEPICRAPPVAVIDAAPEIPQLRCACCRQGAARLPPMRLSRPSRCLRRRPSGTTGACVEGPVGLFSHNTRQGSGKRDHAVHLILATVNTVVITAGSRSCGQGHAPQPAAKGCLDGRCFAAATWRPSPTRARARLHESRLLRQRAAFQQKAARPDPSFRDAADRAPAPPRARRAAAWAESDLPGA